MPWVPNFTKRRKITIDSNKVDSDLTDFPVMIHLASGTGILNQDVSDVFDELSYVWDGTETFTGNDGSTPNSDLWNPPSLGTNCSMEINNNKLRATVPVQSTDDNVQIISKFTISGDFDIQIDMNTVSYAMPSSSASYSYFKIRAGSVSFWGGHQFESYSSSMLMWDSVNYNQRCTPYVADTKIRFVRTGFNVKGYYWDGSQWEWNGSTSGYSFSATTSDPVSLYLFTSGDFNGGTITDFDNLVINAGTIILPDGLNKRKKIAIAGPDGVTQQYVEIENWDSANQEAILWTKVPTISSGTDTDLYLYYGRDVDDNYKYVGDTGELVARNVWNEGFVSVYHLSQYPTGTIYDSTSNLLHGASAGSMTNSDLVDGLIGHGLDFDGGDDRITVSDNLAWDTGSTLSLECVFKTSTNQDGIGLIMHDTSEYKYVLYLTNSSANMTFYVRTSSGVSSAGVSNSTGYYANNNWYYVAGVYDRSLSQRISLYENDSVVDTSPGYDEDISAGDEGLVLGTWNFTNFFGGLLDEVRVSSVARSSAWTRATYYSNFDNLLTFSSEESGPAVYSFGGYVKQYGDPVSRTVRVYRTDTGELIDEATSNATTGYYYLTTTYSGTHYILCLDDPTAPDFNHLVIKEATPFDVV